MASVCSACNSLFAGGDGRTCPSCGEALALAGHPDADFRPPSHSTLHGTVRTPAGLGTVDAARIGLLLAAAALVPVSSFLGVRGWHGSWLWIWAPSLLADAVFTLGTMGAFVASVVMVRQVRPTAPAALASMGAGLVLHWIVYEVSWKLVLMADGEMPDLGGIGFVAWIGGAGLFVSALAGGVATYLLRQGQPDGDPGGRPWPAR